MHFSSKNMFLFCLCFYFHVSRKERGDLCGGGGGGCNFYIKNKLKSEIFNDKKVCRFNEGLGMIQGGHWYPNADYEIAEAVGWYCYF